MNALVYMYTLCISDNNSGGVIAGVVVAVVVVAIVVVLVIVVVGVIWQRKSPEKSGKAHFHAHEPEHVYSHINAPLPSPNGMRDIQGHIEKDDTESVGPPLSTYRDGDKHSEIAGDENPYSLTSNVHLSDKATDEHATVWLSK